MKKRWMVLTLAMEDAAKIDRYLARYADSCMKKSDELAEEVNLVGDILDRLEDAMQTADVISDVSSSS